MQIPMGSNRRIDFYGNAKDGVHVEMVNEKGETFVSRKLNDEQRLLLIDTLTRSDNGRAV
ncbi:hypothetical protein [Paenibacillus odorifer]|uniref:hypothetical protein n=1 Tax=Paenibacillus odorifer TaxID=189426 RepID=UPI00096D079C|nr:hypothetical protein [Paenibacillus odorifer]OMD76850.1 hypothetical protein BSK50_13945 [Paenibacillus odorifer]